MKLFTQDQPYVFHSRATRAPVNVAPAHFASLELSLVLEGSIVFVVDGRERLVEGPSATIEVCRRSLEVYVAAKEPTRAMWCNCSHIRLGEAEWQWLQQLPASQPISKLLMGVFTSGLACARDTQGDAPDMFATQVSDALGVAAFSEYCRQAKHHAEAPNCPPHVCAVKRHLDEHYSKECDINQLARIAGTNPRYLIHLFRKHVGDSPISYLWKRRVRAGVEMLRTTNHTVDEIAYRCGFQTAAHFSRRIKNEHGNSPKQIRRAYRIYADRAAEPY